MHQHEFPYATTRVVSSTIKFSTRSKRGRPRKPRTYNFDTRSDETAGEQLHTVQDDRTDNVRGVSLPEDQSSPEARPNRSAKQVAIRAVHEIVRSALAPHRKSAEERVARDLERLRCQRERAKQRRARETHDEYERRLKDQRERARQRRAEETTEEYEQRLKAQRERARQRRAEETEEEYARRLEDQRRRARLRRAEGTKPRSSKATEGKLGRPRVRAPDEAAKAGPQGKQAHSADSQAPAVTSLPTYEDAVNDLYRYYLPGIGGLLGGQ